MTSDDAEFKDAKYIVWIDYGYEGWRPQGYKTLVEALEAEKSYGSWVLTGPRLEIKDLIKE